MYNIVLGNHILYKVLPPTFPVSTWHLHHHRTHIYFYAMTGRKGVDTWGGVLQADSVVQMIKECVCCACAGTNNKTRGPIAEWVMGSGSSRGSPAHTDPPEYECSALPMAPAINYATVSSPNSLYGFTEPRIICHYFYISPPAWQPSTPTWSTVVNGWLYSSTETSLFGQRAETWKILAFAGNPL